MQTSERKLWERMQKDKKGKVMDKVRSVEKDRHLLAQGFQTGAPVWKNVESYRKLKRNRGG